MSTTATQMLNITYNYCQTPYGIQNMLLKPIRTAIEIAQHNGNQSPAAENLRKLTDDAYTAVDCSQIFPRLYEAVKHILRFAEEQTSEQFCELVCELAAKISDFAATLFKCGEFLAVKGVALWDSKLLAAWGDHANTVLFGWEIFKDTRILARASTGTERDSKEKILSFIRLTFDTSIFALVAFGWALSPVGILSCSTISLGASITREFYEKMNGLQTPTTQAQVTS